jgi:hypothetical protein
LRDRGTGSNLARERRRPRGERAFTSGRQRCCASRGRGAAPRRRRDRRAPKRKTAVGEVSRADGRSSEIWAPSTTRTCDLQVRNAGVASEKTRNDRMLGSYEPRHPDQSGRFVPESPHFGDPHDGKGVEGLEVTRTCVSGPASSGRERHRPAVSPAPGPIRLRSQSPRKLPSGSRCCRHAGMSRYWNASFV